MTIGNNVFVQFSGAVFDSAVAAGSTPVQLCLLCGISGTQVIPVMVTGSGAIVTEEI